MVIGWPLASASAAPPQSMRPDVRGVTGAMLLLLVAVTAQAQPVDEADTVTVASADSAASADLSPRSALLRSTLIPGWGQWSIGHPVKAVIFAGAGAGWLWAAASEASRVDDATTALQREDRAATRNTRVLSYVITAILAGLDAYVDAHLDGFEVDADPFANLGARLSVRF